MENFKIAILGAGQMFGEDDIVAERNYTSAVFCRSNQGFVFCIKTIEFFRKLRPNDECWKIILSQARTKEKSIYRRMKKLDHVFHKETATST